MGAEFEPDRKVDPTALDEKEVTAMQGAVGSHSDEDEGADVNREYPTDEELHTLRRVSDDMPWRTLSIAFVELCERFSYYGTIIVCTCSAWDSRCLPSFSAASGSCEVVNS